MKLSVYLQSGVNESLFINFYSKKNVIEWRQLKNAKASEECHEHTD